MASILVLILHFVIIQGSMAAKIAIMPQFGRSHYMVLSRLGEELMNRGHEVSILVGEDAAYAVGKPAVKSYKIPQQHRNANDKFIKYISTTAKDITVLEMWQSLLKHQQQYCDDFLGSQDMAAEVRAADILISQGMYPCSTLVASKYDLPHVIVNLGPIGSPFLKHFGVSYPLSYVPQMMPGHSVSGNMGLLDRAKNLAFFLGNVFFIDFLQISAFKELKDKHNIKPTKSIKETMATVDLILLGAEFALDYPQPILPYVREVGFFLPAPAKPLPADLEEFMQSSGDDGIVLVSFGSRVESLNDKVKNVMANAFAKFPQKFLWKIDSFTGQLAANIKVMKWLPQNDVLGHPKTKLFITHGGTNGMAEAAYHGVPMVCSPFYGDQSFNCQRIKEIGMGDILVVKDATVDQLVEVLKKVLQEKRYREKSAHVSNIMKKRKRAPTEEAADLIEYVHALGGMSHLKPKGLELPFYQLYMLDVLLLIGVAVVIILALFVWLVKLVIRMCYKVSKKTKMS